MQNIIFNISLYFTGITTCIYTDRGFDSWPDPLDRVAFLVTGPGYVLKCISFWHSNLPFFNFLIFEKIKIKNKIHLYCKTFIPNLFPVFFLFFTNFIQFFYFFPFPHFFYNFQFFLNLVLFPHFHFGYFFLFSLLFVLLSTKIFSITLG